MVGNPSDEVSISCAESQSIWGIKPVTLRVVETLQPDCFTDENLASHAQKLKVLSIFLPKDASFPGSAPAGHARAQPVMLRSHPT